MSVQIKTLFYIKCHSETFKMKPIPAFNYKKSVAKKF